MRSRGSARGAGLHWRTARWEGRRGGGKAQELSAPQKERERDMLGRRREMRERESGREPLPATWPESPNPKLEQLKP